MRRRDQILKDRPSLKVAQEITSLVASDSCGRCVSRLCRPEHWQSAAEKFAVLPRVAVVSGFFVPHADAPETDGPGGAIILARAFLEQGLKAEVWTDGLCIDIFRACALAAGFPEQLVRDVEAENALTSFSPEGVIFTERLGRALDGNYYNMKKRDISAWTPRLDELAIRCAQIGVSTIGIGDGGNEVGMGNFYEELSVMLPDYRECLSVVKTDIAIPVDVSNWGSYALVAALSDVWGVWRGHRGEDERAMTEAIVRSGAVDGVSGKAELTVDGLPLSCHEAVSSGLFEIWKKRPDRTENDEGCI